MIDVKLPPNIKSLTEVVVGYAEQSRVKTTASVTKLDTKELQNIPSVSPVQALQGKWPESSVSVLSGQPGAANKATDFSDIPSVREPNNAGHQPAALYRLND